MEHRFRLRRGDVITVTTISSVAAVLEADFSILYDHGMADSFHIPRFTTLATRTEETQRPSKVALRDGWIVSGQVTAATVLGRGQTYVQAHTRSGGGSGPIRSTLLGDYIFGLHAAPLGRFVDPGPAGGGGNFIIEGLAVDVTPVDVAFNMAATSATRKVYGYAWWYNCAAEVANRFLDVSVLSPLGSGPTGFAIVATIWEAAQLGALTTGQEGIEYANEKFISFNANGTVTYADNTTAPTPFPVWARFGDPMDILFDVTDAHADDRHSIYILYEEWLTIVGTDP